VNSSAIRSVLRSVQSSGLGVCNRVHAGAYSGAYSQAGSMIPPVRTDPVWGRAQSGPVPPEGRTGPSPRLAVLDWTGLVWTSPNWIIFINFKVDPKN